MLFFCCLSIEKKWHSISKITFAPHPSLSNLLSSGSFNLKKSSPIKGNLLFQKWFQSQVEKFFEGHLISADAFCFNYVTLSCKITFGWEKSVQHFLWFVNPHRAKQVTKSLMGRWHCLARVSSYRFAVLFIRREDHFWLWLKFPTDCWFPFTKDQARDHHLKDRLCFRTLDHLV